MRNYPVAEHKDPCQRLSRRHLRLAYDGKRGVVLIDDLGSANGSRFDGDLLAPNHPQVLIPGRDHQLSLAGVINLHVRVIANRSGKPGLAPESRHHHPSGQSPGLTYVMLLGKVRIGGPGADVVVSHDGLTIELTRPRRHWWWRSDTTWQPLVARSILPCHHLGMKADAGDLVFFD